MKANDIRSKVMTIANALVKQGASRSAAMVRAWITIKLNREPENAADKNAVQVIAAVKGKGAAVMGYLNRQLAAAIAPLMDKGKAVASSFLAVTGGADYYLTYGLNIRIAV
ncbi:MAG: HIRAN domain-containing protein [Oscillospiraceae bacterium]